MDDHMTLLYINIIAGIGFLIGGILALHNQRKESSAYKYGTLAGVLLIVAAICQFLSAISYFFMLNI